HEVRVEAPDGWRVWSLLPSHDGVFVADDYDHLADSAFEAGDHREVTFEVAGVPHRFLWAGHAGRPDLDRLTADARVLCEAAVNLLGDLPAERYSFFALAWDQGSGGLEHRDGAVLQLPVHGFADPDDYHGVQSLLTHEYLHLWNGKRLTPSALIRLDYERPVHTESLWVVEGWTSYYDELLPLRAGTWTTATYLGRLGATVQEVLDRPGRALQSVRQASHEAWTKHYVRDENAPNVGVSYYRHGAVLAWCLDLLIRRERADSDGLDEVLRLLWRRHRGGGYEEADVEAAASEVAGCDLGWFFADHVGGVATPPIDDLMEVVGLRFSSEAEEPPVPHLGVQTAEDDRGVRFTSVLRDRPAWEAGLTGGDRLVAIDGTRVDRGELKQALAGYRPGDRVEVAVLRGPRLLTAEVTLGQPRPTRKLQPAKPASFLQGEVFRRWTGHALPAP
ncbi:MAG: PDZ domain-containing protein, partial [Actinomycetota bacterium]|nr:PDZ domain-containing protein [Actinomycetota bacterium]